MLGAFYRAQEKEKKEEEEEEEREEEREEDRERERDEWEEEREREERERERGIYRGSIKLMIVSREALTNPNHGQWSPMPQSSSNYWAMKITIYQSFSKKKAPQHQGDHVKS